MKILYCFLGFLLAAGNMAADLPAGRNDEYPIQLALPLRDLLPAAGGVKTQLSKEVVPGQDGTRLGAGGQMRFPCELNPEGGEISISIVMHPALLASGQQRSINSILTFTGNDGTAAGLSLNFYRDNPKQLLTFAMFLRDGKPVICGFYHAFEPGKKYRIVIAFGKGKVSISVDGTMMKQSPYAGNLKSCTALTLGAIGSYPALQMTLSDVEVRCNPPPHATSRDYPAVSGVWRSFGGNLECAALPDGKLKVSFLGGPPAKLTVLEPVYAAKTDNHIRASGRYRVAASEYGSMMQFLLNNTPQGPVQVMSGDRFFRPTDQCKPSTEPDRFDFSVPGKPGTPYFLSLLFYGNPQTVILENASVRSEKIVRSGRPPVNPEPRAYDRAKTEASLAALPPVRYELRRQGNRVELLLDGKRMPPAIYRRGPHYPFWSRYGRFRDAGIDLYMFYAFLNKPSEPHKMNVGNLWLGKNRYDFSKAAEELRVIHSINPRARVIVALCIDPYDGWERDYPDAVFTNEKGEKGYGFTTAKVVYYGKQVGIEREKRFNEECFAVPSYYSEEFKKEVSKTAGAFAKFLETDPSGRIVCGIHVVGGADGQFFPNDRDVTSGEDHSPAAKRAWSEYLRKIYRDDVSALRKAWGDSGADFENPGIPGNTERGNNNSGKQPSRRGMDYLRFQSYAMAELRLAVFRSIKQNSHRRLMTGSYYPPGTPGNYDIQRMLDAPEVDFLIDILRATPAGSYLLRDKLYIGELDFRVPDVMPPIGNYVFDRKFFESIVRQSEANVVQREGGMFHLLDLGEAYYSNPETVRFFGQVQRELLACLDSNLAVEPVLGVFQDDRKLAGYSFRSASHLNQVIRHASVHVPGHSGVPVQYYIAADALNPALKLPKILWFPLMPEFTPEQFSMLRTRAKAAGSVIVWGYHRPFEAGKRSKCAGYEFYYPQEKTMPQLRAVDTEFTRGLAGKILGESFTGFTFGGPFLMNYEIPARIVPSPGDEVLATYTTDHSPGMIARQMDGVLEIVNGAPGALSPQFFRNLARKQGGEVFSDNDRLVVIAESGMLSVACERGGDIAVTIPNGFTVLSCATGQKYEVVGNQLRFHAADDGEVAFFKFGKKN